MHVSPRPDVKVTLLRFSGGLLLLTAITLGGCVSYPEFGDSEAALAVEDLFAGERPSRLKQATPEPRVRDIEFEAGNRRYEASVFLPGEKPSAGIVLIPGLHKKGRRQKQAVNLGKTLARLRFVVLVPDLVEMRRLEVAESNIGDVVNALRYLKHSAFVDREADVGVIGISYGAGPAVLAAADPIVSSDVDFVITIGGYYDLRNVVRYITTGHVVELETGIQKRAEVSPRPSTKWYFALSNAGLLASEADRVAVRKYTMSRLKRGLFSYLSDEPPPDIGPDAKALLELVRNTDADRVIPLIEALPEPIRRRMRTLNPAESYLGCLGAQVVLVHGKQDNVIPTVEAYAFAARVPHSRLHLLDGFEHVRFRSFNDVVQLVPVWEDVMAQRGRKHEPGASATCE